ncbi:MAG TPA: choice-of-anchor Q domain-containing protein [Anaerolineales bacterium]|nr:choice-of-anchor Q domain-containing protein [Anaerolineales bacterium]
MTSEQERIASAQREINRQLWTCAVVLGIPSCLLVIVSGLLAWSLWPRLSSYFFAEIAPLFRTTPAVLHVRPDGASRGCGSWENACGLQTALAMARRGDEIWVQTGVYTPAPDTRSLEATFQLRDGVALYGGFAGTETTRDQRDWEGLVTVLSGDLGGDDATDPNGVVTDTAKIAGPNAYHVVTGSGVSSTAVLDGFTVTAGYANLTPPNIHAYGGGMFNWTGSPTLRNVIFSGNTAGKGAPGRGGGGMFNIHASNPMLSNVLFTLNTAGSGGGMYNHASNPTLSGVTFTANKAIDSGGMENYAGSRPTLMDVIFSGNQASQNGGGMGNSNASPSLKRVKFQNNSAGDYGGGMANFESSPTLQDVEFLGNRSGREGGGMLSALSSRPVLMNVAFVRNFTTINGGGMLNSESTPTLTNVTFFDNIAAAYGGGMCNTFSSRAELANVTFTGNRAPHGSALCNVSSSATLVNAIVWGNAPGQDQIYNDHATSDITYSDVEGGYPGAGNLNVDPGLAVFGAHGGYASLFALLDGSPLVDRGSPAGCPGSDQRGRPRPADGDGDGSAACDIGAFELQPQE